MRRQAAARPPPTSHMSALLLLLLLLLLLPGNANKTGKEKRAARDRKRQLRDPSAMQLDD